jgi:hypothetical protein
MAAALTYDSLLADISAYAERTDAAFLAQRDRFLMLAENRIASEARGLGMIISVTGNLLSGVNGSAFSKPARWRETVSFTIGTGDSYGTRLVLKLRSYEYCRYYWPDASQTEEPRFYADWDWGHLLVTPTPDDAYPYELIFFERPTPLDSQNETNWTTQYAPQLLTFACLLEASAWVKNADLIKTWQDGYDRALKQVDYESKRRLLDRAMANPNPT